MNPPFRLALIGLCALSLALGPGICCCIAEEVSKDACLECHGPFEKLATAPPSYVAPSGEKIRPHYYVPHTSKEAKAIPECTNCHQPHPTPPSAADIKAMPKPGVDWCYTTCHHENDFTPCTKCHSK
jgi:hypothetical protein